MSNFNNYSKSYLKIKVGAKKLKISEKPNILLIQIGAHDLAHGEFLDNFYRNTFKLLT